MEEFINILKNFNKEISENIIYKLENNKKLNDYDYMYIDFLIREKRRRDRKKS